MGRGTGRGTATSNGHRSAGDLLTTLGTAAAPAPSQAPRPSRGGRMSAVRGAPVNRPVTGRRGVAARVPQPC
ncbi:MAG TPA: hypothetical protein VNA11_14240, partial [Pseudonocardia sp.]|nr:hypothetical protein [Pseudonocardia sp.]